MLTVAELIIQASLNRTESIGAHSRIDTITPKKKELENVK
jgi:aspartate oxidase